MLNAVAELASALHGVDREGSEIAHALMTKSMGVGAISPDAPTWHPSHPMHPLHDAWQENGNAMYVTGDMAGKHPIANREAATARARSAIDSEVHPGSRLFFNRLLDADPSLAAHAGYNPVHPGHPAHDAYLANPTEYHRTEYHGAENWITSPAELSRTHLNRQLTDLSRDESHPLNPKHPDHPHLMEAHASGHFSFDRLMSPYENQHHYDPLPGYPN